MAVGFYDRLGHVRRERSDDWFGRVERTPIRPKVLALSAIELQKYGIVSSFPWTVKPLIGMISDGIPIFGYNRDGTSPSRL